MGLLGNISNKLMGDGKTTLHIKNLAQVASQRRAPEDPAVRSQRAAPAVLLLGAQSTATVTVNWLPKKVEPGMPDNAQQACSYPHQMLPSRLSTLSLSSYPGHIPPITLFHPGAATGPLELSPGDEGNLLVDRHGCTGKVKAYVTVLLASGNMYRLRFGLEAKDCVEQVLNQSGGLAFTPPASRGPVQMVLKDNECLWNNVPRLISPEDDTGPRPQSYATPTTVQPTNSSGTATSSGSIPSASPYGAPPPTNTSANPYAPTNTSVGSTVPSASPYGP
eukprot:gene7678-1373_t